MQETNRRLTDADLQAIQTTMKIVLEEQREKLGKEQYIRMSELRAVLLRIDRNLDRLTEHIAGIDPRRYRD